MLNKGKTELDRLFVHKHFYDLFSMFLKYFFYPFGCLENKRVGFILDNQLLKGRLILQQLLSVWLLSKWTKRKNIYFGSLWKKDIYFGNLII